MGVSSILSGCSVSTLGLMFILKISPLIPACQKKSQVHNRSSSRLSRLCFGMWLARGQSLKLGAGPSSNPKAKESRNTSINQIKLGPPATT